MEQAANLARKRNLEGISATPVTPASYTATSNSFAILSNDEIMKKSSLMGVGIPSDNFESIDLLKQLEEARKNLGKKLPSNNVYTVDHDSGQSSSLYLTWYDKNDADHDFVLVQSRKN